MVTQLTVQIAVDVLVTPRFRLDDSLVRYTHRNQETWLHDRLVGIQIPRGPIAMA